MSVNIELVEKIPVLEKHRRQLRAKGVDEAVFLTGVKTGKIEASKLNSNGTFEIGDQNILELNNEDYRLQLNPKSDVDSKVSLPTQMTYFPNLFSEGKIRNLANQL